jgi:hypothetical protein
MEGKFIISYCCIIDQKIITGQFNFNNRQKVAFLAITCC